MKQAFLDAPGAYVFVCFLIVAVIFSIICNWLDRKSR
jgi:hypothetical protein